jgi:ABC-type bacteriocin/lantibiotic exporter with double-glycine peptidase domain
MKLYTFLFLNFIVGFLSDIILNDLSSNYDFVPSLKSYFKDNSIIISAFYAGITILVALLVTICTFKFFYNLFVPNNIISLFYFCIIAFIIGYTMDYFIYALKIFGNRLDEYYKKVGYGFWGATAFVFSILISYFIQNKILPIL